MSEIYKRLRLPFYIFVLFHCSSSHLSFEIHQNHAAIIMSFTKITLYSLSILFALPTFILATTCPSGYIGVGLITACPSGNPISGGSCKTDAIISNSDCTNTIAEDGNSDDFCNANFGSGNRVSCSGSEVVLVEAVGATWFPCYMPARDAPCVNELDGESTLFYCCANAGGYESC